MLEMYNLAGLFLFKACSTHFNIQSEGSIFQLWNIGR